MTPSHLKIYLKGNQVHLLLALLVILTVEGLHAQRGYVPGYIILETKDTLYGMVRDRNNFSGEIYQKIKFKQKGRRAKRYTAHDIIGYNNGTHTFTSLWYHEEGNFLRMAFYASPHFKEKAFLIVYSEGILSVYGKEFSDDTSYGNSFPLFKKAGDDYYVRATQGILGLKKKQLARYFSDCPGLVNRIDTGDLKRTYEVAEYYNGNCVK